MADEHWQWQEWGKAWKGVGLYHVTLIVPSRLPLLGRLVIPDNDAAKAKVERTALGDALVDALLDVPRFHPAIQILHFCLMPDHLHAVWYVKHSMSKGIAESVRGFWQGIKKLGRAHTFLTSSSFSPNAIRENNQEEDIQPLTPQKERIAQHTTPQKESGNQPLTLQEEKIRLFSTSETLRQQLGDELYYNLSSIFTEMPFIRPMWQRRQLPATIRYIDMNPQQLATKRLMPGFFRVQTDIEIAGRTYSGVGNVALLQAERYQPVHVRSVWVQDAEQHGHDQPLRDYMNRCVVAARKGTVMVSPFISQKEKEVLEVLLREGQQIIYIADNGFRDYYKPADGLFDTIAAGRMLIVSPWEYDEHKRHVTRKECVLMNRMAEEICAADSI